MLLFTHIAPLKGFIAAQKAAQRTIGFVPTMGALHKGHVSLIQQSREKADLTICSIFVNPTQFNNRDDLANYPRTIEQDIIKLSEAGCDVLFHPLSSEMYPDGLRKEEYHWEAITHSLEGSFRPGHFDGVITVVKRLFEVVEPDYAFFGQKDFQQCAVISNMVRVFQMPLQVITAPTMRESDGLAMSSRNVRLTQEERKQALLLSAALYHLQQNVGKKPLTQLLVEAEHKLAEGPAIKLEYLSVVDVETLEPVVEVKQGAKCVALLAAWCGNVRLIDNMVLGD